jgi:hypothetical protein
MLLQSRIKVEVLPIRDDSSRCGVAGILGFNSTFDIHDEMTI